MVRRLLAKHYDRNKHGASPPGYALLSQHSRDVATACDALANVLGRIALFNAEIDIGAFDHFRLMLRTNGWIQDLGKVSSHFQEMVTTAPQIRQLLRHETISVMLVWLEPRLRSWLLSIPERVLRVAVWGAIGHHRKFDEQTSPEKVLPLAVHVSHQDFAEILSDMSVDLKLPPPPRFDRDLVIAQTNKEDCDLPARESIYDLQEEFAEHETDFEGAQERRMLALVKAFGIAADVAASAVAVRGQCAMEYSLSNYVHDSIAKIGLQTSDLTKLINRWAWNHSACDERTYDESMLPPGFVIREFQNNVADSESFLTLAQGGCGSGKSLAAYMWAREWCDRLTRNGRTNFRLFFCLPTTGTTTEHFKDYALESGIDASLTHSRSSVDLETIAETVPQEEANTEDTDAAEAARAALNATRDKIESLALWSTPVVVTTSDTVLGLMANARRAIYSLPAIMSSVIVFDEIHAFDEQMFGHLLVFLKNFPRLPVLLMTASLPSARLNVIKSIRPDLNCVSGPSELETHERYIINSSTADEAMWYAVGECIADGGKVLWVRNRVEWANRTYQECSERFLDHLSKVAINVYHSRFRYKDRSKRHRRVIDSFNRSNRPAILVTTQVAEMSLDLSADLLVTDMAPIPSLIQRMGRLNRRSSPDNPKPPKLALIRALPEGESNSHLPYCKSELEMAELWLRSLINHRRALNQRDLSDAFSQIDEADEYDMTKAEERAVFFSGLWRTRPGMIRGEGHTINVILQADFINCTERDGHGEPSRNWLRRNEVSIPIRGETMKWDRIGAVRVAPSEAVEYDYDETTGEGTGAKWRKS